MYLMIKWSRPKPKLVLLKFRENNFYWTTTNNTLYLKGRGVIKKKMYPEESVVQLYLLIYF